MATLVENKKARLKYAELESFAAGLVLSGQEVKALRGKLGSLDGSRVVVRGGEAFLLGMTIPPTRPRTPLSITRPMRRGSSSFLRKRLFSLRMRRARKD